LFGRPSEGGAIGRVRAPVWPYYVKPRTYWPGEGSDPLQNTDPFVFGDRFLYTLCRQWRSATNRPFAPA